MAKKYAAISNRFPFLSIPPNIQFTDGVFETDNEDDWATLQRNEWFGIHIHPRDAEPPVEATPPAEPVAEPPSEETESPRVVRGSRGSRS